MRSRKIERFCLVLLILGCSAWMPGGYAQEVRMLVQRSALAGYRYHEAPRLAADLVPGERLDLNREVDNPYDGNAVRVDWQGYKLGYVPRRQNAALAWAMDSGQTISARIVEPRLRRRASRKRVEFEIYVE